MDDCDFRELLRVLGLSWKGYRRVQNGVKKRIRKHMQQLGLGSVSEYLTAVQKDPGLMSECERLMTVPISRFFRDRRLWESLQDEILPWLASRNQEGLRVWSAGCASGEEPYSLKIVWEAIRDVMGPFPDLQVLATDLNPVYLHRAMTGLYPESSLKEMAQPFKACYFRYIKEQGLYRIKDLLKVGVEWRVHHLLSDPPPVPCFQLVCLRNNLLTYYEKGDAIEGVHRVLGSLEGGGFFIIGANERLPDETIGRVDPHPRFRYVFRKPLPRGERPP